MAATRMDRRSTNPVPEEWRVYWRSGQTPCRLAMGAACRGGGGGERCQTPRQASRQKMQNDHPVLFPVLLIATKIRVSPETLAVASQGC